MYFHDCHYPPLAFERHPNSCTSVKNKGRVGFYQREWHQLHRVLESSLDTVGIEPTTSRTFLEKCKACTLPLRQVPIYEVVTNA
jgi:hypothetical protein